VGGRRRGLVAALSPRLVPALRRATPAGFLPHTLSLLLRAQQERIHRTHGGAPFGLTAVFSVPDPLHRLPGAVVVARSVSALPERSDAQAELLVGYGWSTALKARHRAADLAVAMLALRQQGSELTVSVPPLSAHALMAIHAPTGAKDQP